MANYFDQFDGEAKAAGNYFDRFDGPPPPKTGKAAQDDFLRAELRNADWFTRNLAGAGTALSDLWERGKQLVGKGDEEAIHANKVIAEEAPAGAVAGQVATAVVPFGMVGNSVKGAIKVGAALGAARPVDGAQTFENIATGTVKNVATDAALGGAGQVLANAGGKYVAKKLADLAVARAQGAPKTELLNSALDEGLVVPPASVNPTFANVTKEGIAGKVATAQDASNRNAPVLESLVRRSIGLADDVPLTVEATQAVRAKAYADGYKPIADLPEIVGDTDLLAGLRAIAPSAKGGAIKSAAHAEIDDMVGAIASQGRWTGAELIKDIQALREQAASNFGGTAAEKALAKSQKDAAKLLEDLAERNIIANGGSPGQVEALRDSRKLIAKAFTAEKSILKGGGSPDWRVFAARAREGKPLEGEQELIGNFARDYPRAAQPTAQIAGPAVSKLNTLAAILTGSAGHVAGGPLLGAAAAAAPFVVPFGVRKQLLGQRSQNALRDLYQLGRPTRAANALLKYAPAGFTVLGPEAFAE